MTPDPNENEDFTGSFAFEANIGDTLVFSYYKAYEVTIIAVSYTHLDVYKRQDK